MDGFSVPILTALTLIITVYILWLFLIYRTSKKLKETHPIPPGPRGLPILGYLPFLQLNLHKQFTELAEKYGPVYRLWLGSKLCVVISSPSLIKEVVRDQDTTFANRDPPVSAIVITGGLDIVWSSYGQYWRDMRKLFAREMLSSSNLAASYVHRKEEVEKVVKSLYTKAGSCVEIGELIFVTELNVVLNMLWGGTMDRKIIDRIACEFREVMSKLVDLLGKPNVSDFLPVLAKFDVQGIEKEAKRLVPCFHELLDSLISERMKTIESGQSKDGSRKDFLQILLELKEQEDSERSISINLPQIKAILMDIVVGGTDTTATTIEWVMAEVLNNPQVKGRVQEELAAVVGLKNKVEESHIQKLQYLAAVLRETFRLHPPIPLLVPRVPNQRSIIGGYTIPEGSRVFLNVWSIHRDPLVWENPSEFKPDRFLNDPGNFDFTGNNFQYLPFGSGRRICPGILLAERMVMHLLATLFHLFDWKLPEGEKLDLSEKFGIVMRKRTPLIAIPSPRLHDPDMYT